MDDFHSRGIRQVVYTGDCPGVLVYIVSDRDRDQDPRFTTHFLKSFQREMGTQLMMSAAFHPQKDGQSERTIQILEEILRACVLDLHGS